MKTVMCETSENDELINAALEAAENPAIGEMIFFKCPHCEKIAACTVGENGIIIAKCGYCRKKSAGIVRIDRR